ncbi:GDSL-type esterase/lipase family protein [Mollicutes bacterium LVI A0039]|nr:GDSL-type esterase/lipase family protein [Mollicutes bacterium LVI A0039]
MYNQIYNDRRSWFLNQRSKEEHSIPVDIVQIGDSITEGFNIARYVVTDKVIVNSGVGGDVTDILLQRYQRDCLGYNPKVIILMIGINDIRTYFTKQQYIERTNIKQLVEEVSNNIVKLIEMSSTSKLVWCKILPINEFELNSYYINSVIDKVNLKIETAIKTLSYVEVVCFDNIITYDKRLDANITYDGLHPNDDGYYLMSQKLKYLLTSPS